MCSPKEALTAIVRHATHATGIAAVHNTRMDDRRRVALKLAYLGGGFAGWQRQPGARTVQAVVEAAIELLYRMPVRVVGAGRTDAGVHAAGQVAHFDPPLAIPLGGVMKALNTALPSDVRVLRVCLVPAAYHARRSATGKRYRYRLSWGLTLPPREAIHRAQIHGRLDTALIGALVPQIEGEHDFRAFALSGHAGHGSRGTVRTVTSARLLVRGRRLDIILEGDGFLRGMVRRIVGALIEVGRGAQPPGWLAALLREPGTRPPAPTAPAHGLTLERVLY